MIPNICHFVFGLKEQKDEFSFCFYIAVFSAYIINNPSVIHFYYHYEPFGRWWDKLKNIPVLKLEKIDIPMKIGNKPIHKVAHKADWVRMNMLFDKGGIYLDIDTICIEPWKQLLDNDVVLGKQSGHVGICNAIMFTVPKSEFFKIWLDKYESEFNPGGWNEASINLPYNISKQYPNRLTLKEPNVFFLPNFNETENIFVNNRNIPSNLISLHLWETFSLQYMKKIDDWDWAYKNSHTMYGKMLLNLVDNYIIIDSNNYFAHKQHFKKQTNHLICTKNTFLKKTLKQSSHLEKNMEIRFEVGDKLDIVHDFNDIYFVASLKEEVIAFSCADKKRFPQLIESQKKYFEELNIKYAFYDKPYLNQVNNFHFMILKMIDLMKKYQKIIYLDDDILIHDCNVNLCDILDDYTEDIIVSTSPNRDNNTPLINTGIILLKNSEKTKDIFNKINELFHTGVKLMNNNYKKEWGFNSNNGNGDQSKFIYITQNSFKENVKILNHNIIQSRDNDKNNCGIIHFAGNNKLSRIQNYLKENNKPLKFIHIIHRIDKTNTGDMVSNCSEYYSFEGYEIIKHDIYNPNFTKIEKDDPIILSGGGLLNCLEIWNKNINKLLELSRNVYGWGIGFNKHHNTNVNTKLNLSKFKLLGIRDYRPSYESNMKYVPCSSCNLKQLKYTYEIQRDIGIVEHHHNKITLSGNYDKINNEMNIDKIIKFIGESRIIITNTYHVLYFSALLKKKCILYNSFSEKFNNLKFQHIKYESQMKFDEIKSNEMNEGFLQNCIDINDSFYFDILSKLKY